MAARIVLCIEHDGYWSPFYAVTEWFARQYLGTVRDALDTLEPNTEERRVNIHGASLQSLRYVLGLYREHGERTEMGIAKVPLSQGLAIYEAVRALGVDQRHPKIEGHLVGYVAHNKLTVDDLTVIQKSLGHLGRTNRVWASMVNQITWWLGTSKYPAEEEAAIIQQVTQYPVLHAAVQEKLDELNARPEFRERKTQDIPETEKTETTPYQPSAPLKDDATPPPPPPPPTPRPQVHLRIGNINFLNHGEIQGAELREGIRSVNVEVIVDAGVKDLDEIQEEVFKWMDGLKATFGKPS